MSLPAKTRIEILKVTTLTQVGCICIAQDNLKHAVALAEELEATLRELVEASSFKDLLTAPNLREALEGDWAKRRGAAFRRARELIGK